MSKSALLPVALALLVAAAPAAQAAERDPHRGQATRVVLELVEEGWVASDTARAMVAIDTAVRPENVARAPADIQAAIDGLADADWRVTSFMRRRDETGLPRWRVLAEARLDAAAVSRLNDRAEDASEPGFRVSVIGLDYSPTLDEREAALADLRTAIRTRAEAERIRLARELGTLDWRIGRVDTTAERFVADRPMMMTTAETSRAVAAAPKSGGNDPAAPGLPVAERLMLSAKVLLVGTPQD